MQYYIGTKQDFDNIGYPSDYLSQKEINKIVYLIEPIGNVDWQNELAGYIKFDLNGFVVMELEDEAMTESGLQIIQAAGE